LGGNSDLDFVHAISWTTWRGLGPGVIQLPTDFQPNPGGARGTAQAMDNSFSINSTHSSVAAKPTADLRRWYAWAVLCFVPTLFFQYVGEEAVYTLTSLEMWQRQEYMSTVMYGMTGGGGGRPPLFNWLVIPLANAIGWEHVLVATRSVTVLATLGTSGIIGWLAGQIWRDTSTGWLAALLYLVTVDVLLFRGWLAYSDPLFAMWVVLAIALAWVACLRSSYTLLAWAMGATFAAFLTKALTAYLFLGVAWVVLMQDRSFRRFLLRPPAWLIYGLAMVLPLAWFKLGTHDAAQHATMSRDIWVKLSIPNALDYLQRLLTYPLETWVRLMPASFFITYLLFRARQSLATQHPAMWMALAMAGLNFLPYWLAPHGGARYVLPIYALLALAAAHLLTRYPGVFKLNRWVPSLLAVATLTNLLAYPYYQKTVRGENYAQVARELVEAYGSYPLYVSNVSATGLSIAANINRLQLDQAALVSPPADFDNGIVIAYSPTDVPGTLLRRLAMRNDAIYLICRGAACAADATD
jgi:hypothetical protein